MPSQISTKLLALATSLVPKLIEAVEADITPIDLELKVAVCTQLLLTYAEHGIQLKTVRRHLNGKFVHAHKGRGRRRSHPYVPDWTAADTPTTVAEIVAEVSGTMTDELGERAHEIVSLLWEQIVSDWTETVDDYIDLRL